MIICIQIQLSLQIASYDGNPENRICFLYPALMRKKKKERNIRNLILYYTDIVINL